MVQVCPCFCLSKSRLSHSADLLTVESYFSFDIMGDLAFGRSFNMMKDNTAHDFFKATHTSMVLIGIFSVSRRVSTTAICPLVKAGKKFTDTDHLQRVVWLFPIFKATVGRREYQKQQGLIKSLVQRRIDVSL